MTITGHFERFQYFNFEINFLKERFLVESPRIENSENAPFSCKTALAEAILRQNGLILKNRVFQVTTLVFRKFCFSLRISGKELI